MKFQLTGMPGGGRNGQVEVSEQDRDVGSADGDVNAATGNECGN